MKKYIFLSAMACLCACTGNKNNNDASLTEAEVIELEETVVNHLDSLANILCDSTQLASYYSLLEPSSIELTDDQKLVKPDYLIENKDIESLVTLSEKYRAHAIAMVDSRVTKLYGMDNSSEFVSLIERLEAEIADKAISDMAANNHRDVFMPETYVQFYENMKEAKRLPYFYESTTAMVVETLYILSKTDDTLVSQLSDDQSQALVRHLNVVTDAIDVLSQTNPHMKRPAEQLKKLATINASTTSELQEQLAKSKNDIAALRRIMMAN